MSHSILVPLDGSPSAEHALPWALSIAQQEGAALHLVRVHLPPVPIVIGSEIAADIALDDALRKQEASYLEDLVDKLRPTCTVQIQQTLLEGGITEAIHDHAIAIKADLIVLTSHGRGAFARFWLGSVADKIIRHSTVPTLLVRPNDDVAVDLTARPFIHRIVIPLDGSELAERIIDPAIKLGKATGAEFSLVLVLEAVEDIEALAARKIQSPGGWFPEATETKAKGYLESVAHRLRGHSLKVYPSVIEHGSAAAAILDYAKNHGNPMIALATHGRSGLKRMILGSVADKIIRGAAMPVLIYHPAEAK
ncbi:MAG: universal stress protein [Planctomycetes bacterium]|nr:universal stress protein [Planctomycetota bacterium]